MTTTWLGYDSPGELFEALRCGFCGAGWFQDCDMSKHPNSEANMDEHTYFPDWASYPRDGRKVCRVTRDSCFPDADKDDVDDPNAPDSYVALYRGCEVEFKHGPDVGNWEVSCTNPQGKDLWSASTALWCPQMPRDGIMRFSHAIEEARAVFTRSES